MLDYREEYGSTGTAQNIDINYITTTWEALPGFPTIPAGSVIIWLQSLGAESIGSYKYRVDKGLTNFIPLTTTSLPVFTLSGFEAGQTYTIFAQSFTGANGTGTSGALVSRTFTRPSDSNSAFLLETIYGGTGASLGNTAVIDNAIETISAPITSPSAGKAGINNQTVSPSTYSKTTKSLFKLTQLEKDSKVNSVAYKDFTQIDTTKSYYSFGTTLFFDSTIDNTVQSGGFGFFVNNLGQDGYFIKIETTSSSAANSSREEFKIYRMKDANLTRLEDSQKTPNSTIKGIYGGQAYKIDIKVAQDNTKRIITAYVNGFKVTATDSDTTKLLPVTNKVAMLCNYGATYFDYVYGMTIDLDSYNKDYLYNIYDGHYPNNLISFLYGEKVAMNDPLITISNNGFIEEFGAVARELRVVKTKYESRPAFPIYASTGLNPFAKIVGQKLTSSGAEVYVLNNAGTYIPLDDSQYYSFYILGKYVSQSGQLEYIENSASEYTSQEPVIFQSNWIQKNSDVVALANWIKSVWSKKQMVLNMSVFGNPLLTVGDIITVNYPYNGLTGTEKFLITNVSHDYNQGLGTSITCRTI